MANTPVKQNSAPPARSERKVPHLGEYYGAVSGKFRAAKFVTIIALVVFLIFSFAFLRDDITLENLRYLLKFISFTNTETSITAAKINYASGDPNRLELFMGDFCTLTPGSYALYDSRGNQIMSEPISYVAPVLKVGNRYALCYDMDGHSYTLLNSFAKLHEGSSDYPITAGAVSNDGSYAIASASREYQTSITVYNDDFSPVTKISKNDYLMDLEFSPDSSALAVVTAAAINGSFYTKIEFVSPNSDKILNSVQVAGLGYTIYFFDNGYALVTDDGIIFLDSALTTVKRIRHDKQLSMTDCSGKYLTCVYSDGILGNTSIARVYSQDGRMVYEGGFADKLIAVDSDESGDYVFLLTGTTLSRINLLNKKIGALSVAADAIDMLAQDGSSVIVALKNYALTYDLTDFHEQYYEKPDADTPGTTAKDTEPVMEDTTSAEVSADSAASETEDTQSDK